MSQVKAQIQQDLTLREHALWTAITSGNPGPPVAKMCSPDAVMIFPDMPVLSVQGEHSILHSLQPKFHRFDNYSLEDIKAIVIGSTAGVVTYTVTAARGTTAYHASASTTWGQDQESDGEWKIICHQETL